jgi:hypothetical protein
VATGERAGRLSFLRNNGDGTFTVVSENSGAHSAVFISDLDGDGDGDMAITNEQDFSVSIYKNNGNGTFASKVDYTAGNHPYSVFISDLDGDGDGDLTISNLYSSSANGTVSILKNNGDGTFAAGVEYGTTGEWPFRVVVSDLDNDGDGDLVVSNTLSSSVSIFKNIQGKRIIVTAGANGVISPSDTVSVDSGGTQTFHIVPNTGYWVDSLFVDEVFVDSTTSYTFYNVTADHTIRSVFRLATIQDGMIAYYPFNGNANDESGNGNNGTVNGAILDKDRFLTENAAYRFSGSSYIAIPELFQAGQASLTISAWVTTEELNNVDHAVYYKGTIQGELGFGISGNTFGFGVKLADNQWYKVTDTIPHELNRYYHVLARYQRGKSIDYWLNGKLIDSRNVPDLALWITTPPTISSIGAVYGGTMNLWKGIIDDVRIYGRLLSQSEIDSLYDEGGWPPPPKHIIATAGPHGTIIPIDTVEVDSAGTQSFIFKPNTGYYVDSVIVDGILVDSTTGYTFYNVKTDHTIRVVFAIHTYTISSSAGEHGTISPGGENEYGYGSSQRFLFYPAPGFEVIEVRVDGGVVDSTEGYTFENITDVHTIHVIFNKLRSRVGLIVSQSTFSRNLSFGVRPGAAYGIWEVDPDASSIDSAEGELEVPPPVAGYFDARFIDPNGDYGYFGQGSWVDVRNFTRSIQTDSFLVRYQRAVNPSPVVFRWSPEAVSAQFNGLVTIGRTPGTSVNMKLVDSLVISNTSVTDIYIIAKEPNLPVIFESGWNLVSLPVIVEDGSVDVLFPGVSSTPFSFDVSSGYQVESVLEPGPGYWLKFPFVIQTQEYTGTTRTSQTLDVSAGWNLIGSLTNPISVASIGSNPPGIVTGQFFGYNRGYFVATTLEPRMGYWVKVSQAGQLFLSSTGANFAGKIVIMPTGELPPPPPGGTNEVGAILPTEYSIGQNYPNPFNPTTTLTYALPVDGVVQLWVFNILGQEVALLVRDYKQAGVHTVLWDASPDPSGVYFYKITAGSFSQTKKMLLMK